MANPNQWLVNTGTLAFTREYRIWRHQIQLDYGVNAAISLVPEIIQIDADGTVHHAPLAPINIPFASLSASDQTNVQTALSLLNGVIGPWILAQYGPQVPTFNIGSGTLIGAQSLQLSTPNGGNIYYTTDGTTPTVNSTLYTVPIPITKSETVMAISSLNGAVSSVGSAIYVVQYPVVPVFSLNAGTFFGAQTLSLTVSDGGTIYYTTDGTTPNVFSGKYIGSITLSNSEIITAINILQGVPSTPVAEAFVINYPVKPVFSLPAGPYSGAQILTLTVSDGGTIYYTTDGTIPTIGSTKYTGPITISTSETINAINILNNITGPVGSAAYTIS